MKNIFRYLGVAAMLCGIVHACSPEQINHPSEAGIPDATLTEPVIEVDQEINQVTFSLPAGTKSLIPVWIFQDKTGEWSQYSAQNGLKKIFTVAGDYTVRMQLLNSNGVSPNYVEKTFHIDNTLMNFDKYNTMLTGGSSKEWRIDNSVAGHMGCGESGTTGTGWWSAPPDDKKDWGVYDNRMTFTLEGNVYDFNPGAAGTIYINTGITDEPYGSHRTDDGNDYLYPVEAQTSEWNWEVEGEDLYLVLPPKTYWPYYPNMDFVNNPRLKVESISTKTIELVADNGSIAWHFTLTSGAAEVKFTGFNYSHEANLWKTADAAHSYSQFYATGSSWETLPNPEVKYANATYSFNLPTETQNQWQCQFFVIPDSPIALESSKTYDYSVVLNASNDIKGVTLKLTDAASDDNFLFTENVDLTAFEDYVFYLSDVPGIDAAAIKMVFDFGGNPANTDISIGNIVLKDHAIDDGTVLPSKPDEPVSGPEEFVYDAPSNLWKAADAAHSYSQFYATGSSWDALPNPEVNYENATYSFSLPTETQNQWQCQFFIIPDAPIALEAAKSYDFSVVLSASNDIKGVTLKLTDVASDDNFLFTERVDLTAFEEYVFDISDKKIPSDAAAVKMVFDFGGNPANTDIVIKRIVLKDHSVDDGTHKGGSTDPGINTEGTDLWDNSKVTYTWWYSASDWSGALTPDISTIANGWKVIIPEGIGGGEWQGQTHFTLDAPASASKTYDFCVTINSSAACTCTVKLAWEGNDTEHEFFYDGNVQVSAYEDVKYIKGSIAPDTDYDKIALFIDLGRTPAGSEVEIKDIHLYEH